MSINKLFESWRTFTQDNKEEAPKEYSRNALTDKSTIGPKYALPESEEVLGEIEDHQLDMIKQYLGDDVAPRLSFANIFDDDIRKLIPLVTEDADSEIYKLKEVLKSLGYSVDWKNAIASKKVKRFVPKLGKEIEREEKVKIGKLLSNIASFKQKMAKLDAIDDEYVEGIRKIEFEREYDEETGRRVPKTPEQEKELEDLQKKQNEIREKIGEIYDKLEAKYGRGMYRLADKHGSYEESGIKKHLDFWNKQSEFYRNNPEEAEGKQNVYSIIISRAPIDVIRMSDHGNWRSCHSPNEGEYFACAIAESIGHGLVAYVVKNEDLKDGSEKEEKSIEEFLGQPEIFKDAERGVKGIKPLSRLRLRKFSFEEPTTEETKFIAVPEQRVYGKRFPNFEETVEKWSREAQKDVNPINYDKEGKAVNPESKPRIGTFRRYGGSYADSSDSNLLNNFFGLEDDREQYSYHNVKWEDPGEDDFKGSNLYDEYEERVSELQQYYDNNLEYCGVYSEVADEGFGDVHVSFGGSFVLDFSKEGLEVSGEPKWNDRSFSDDLRVAVNETNGYQFDDWSFDRYRDSAVLRLDIHSEGYDWDPDGFESFGDWINDDWDNNYEEIKDAIVLVFQEHGFITPNPITAFGDELENIEFENFTIDNNRDNLSITQDEPFYLGISGLDSYKVSNLLKSQHIRNTLGGEIEKLFNSFRYKQLRLPGIGSSELEDRAEDFDDFGFPFEADTAVEVEEFGHAEPFDGNRDDYWAKTKAKYGVGHKEPSSDDMSTTHYRDFPDYERGIDKKIGFKISIYLTKDDEDHHMIDQEIFQEYLLFLDKNFHKFGVMVKEYLAKEIQKNAKEYMLQDLFKEIEDKVDSILSELEPYQRDLKKKHPSWKLRLIGKGGNKKREAPFVKNPSMQRSKSAPPGAGGS